MVTYTQLNPATVLRDFMIGSPESRGFSFPQIFGLPVAPGPGGGVATGRAIDMSGTPGQLAGSIVVANPRDLLGAAAQFTVAKATGTARDNSVNYARSTVAFSCKQFDGKSRMERQFVVNGFHESEELHLADQAANAVRIKTEIYTADFFTKAAGEAASKLGGWTEMDWINGLSGSALGSSNSTLEVLYSAINSLKLTGNCRPNSLFCSEQVMQKFSTDPQILSRIVTGDISKGVSSIIGSAVAPESHVRQVLKEHLGIENLVVGAAIQQPQASGVAGVSEYIWPANRLWIGESGDVSMAIRPGASPRVLSGAGGFCAVFTELFGSEIGFEKENKPMFLEAVVESHMDLVALQPTKGALIHNLY